VRGWDSTGIALVDKNKPHNKPVVYKRALEASDFINTRKFPKLLASSASHNVFIGHNRWATRGGVNDETAHPYQHDDIVLAHNGTLEVNTGLGEWVGNRRFETDSEEIAYALSLATDETKVLEAIEGAYALTWYNSTNNELHFARNEDRPFYFVFSKNMKNVYWASESDMLRCALNRKGIDIDVGKVYYLVPGNRICFDMAAETFDLESSYRAFVPYQAPVYSNYGQRGYTGTAGNWNSSNGNTTKKTTPPAGGSNSSTSSVIGKGVENPSPLQLENLLQVERGEWYGAIAKDVDRTGTDAKGNEIGTLSCYVPTRFNNPVAPKEERLAWRVLVHKVDLKTWKELLKDGEVPICGRLGGLWMHQETKQPRGRAPMGVMTDVFEAGTMVDYRKGELYWTFPKLVDEITEQVSDEPEESWDDMYLGPNGSLIKEEEYKRLTAEGCSHCAVELTVANEDDFEWVGDKPVCDRCIDTWKLENTGE